MIFLKVKAQKATKGRSFPNLFSGPDVMTKLRADPRTSAFLNDPEYLALLAQLQSNPQAMQNKLQDPRVLTTLAVLMGINISQFNAPFNKFYIL